MVGSEKFAPRIRVPVLMLAAGDDQVVSSKAIEDLAIRLAGRLADRAPGLAPRDLARARQHSRAVLGGVRRLRPRRRARARRASPRAAHRRFVHALVARGEDAAAVARIAALPSGDDAAGPLDDRDQGNDVEGLEAGLDHEVDMAHRQQAVIVAIAAEAPQAHGAAQGGEALVLVFGGEDSRCWWWRAAPRRDRRSARAHGLGRCRHGGRRLRVSPLQKRSPVKG